MKRTIQDRLNEPVTRHMHQQFTQLHSSQTVGEALDWLRQHPPPARIVYFYVVDQDGRLEGVVPTRRLILSPPEVRLADVMGRKLLTLPAHATVLEACEFFIQYGLLGFPIVDDERHILGVVDIDLYTGELARLSSTPVERWLKPLAGFLHVESASGIVLLLCAVIALVLANSPWAGAFAAFWETPLQIGTDAFGLRKPLLLWINDGLMTLFFFVVGLEIKREVVSGELSEPRKVMLPIVAALGGMVVPALVYLALQWGQPTSVGWGIPMATDIAFVVGFLAVLGKRVPHSLKVLLLSLAIADDIGATLVIAFVYTSELILPALAIGGASFGLVLLARWIGVRQIAFFFLPGLVIWVAFVKSGVHPTVAGVALGLLTPARPLLGGRQPIDVITDLFKRTGLALSEDETAPQRREAVAPLERLERALHPWVAYLVMPIFALANAGVGIELAELGKPVALAVAAGLILGKPLGIVLFSWGAVRIGLARLPAEINTKVLIGAGCLAGIGFTMSLFIASLALTGHELAEAKIGILAGSSVSAVLGSYLLWRYLPAMPVEAGKAKVEKHDASG